MCAFFSPTSPQYSLFELVAVTLLQRPFRPRGRGLCRCEGWPDIGEKIDSHWDRLSDGKQKEKSVLIGCQMENRRKRVC